MSTTSSSMMHSSDGSSTTSGSCSYTSASYSTAEPPSHLKLKIAPTSQTTISAISDPSGESSSASGYPIATKPVFSAVMEETSSALDEASSDPSGTATSNTRSTMDADGVAIEISSTNPPSPAGPTLPLECDYDVSPTELYQTIEAKRWDRLDQLLANDSAKAQKQAATWVLRKEVNGRLRWRLLPIHAAVIFQSPEPVVEKLLHLCPEAAQAKDDQGMLPLHLAFRTKSTCWETIEELITSYPQAIFVKDRKGRTPLECGLAAASAAAAAEGPKTVEHHQLMNITPTSSLMGALAPKPPVPCPSGRAIMTPTVQKSIFSVLDLYTQISVQDQLQTAMHNSRKALETRIGAVQDSHVATLTQLKNDWENQRNELSRKIQGYRKEIQNLKSDFNIQQELLEEKVKTEMELVDKLQQVTTALETKTVMDDETAEEVARDITNMQTEELHEAHKKTEVLKKTNKELLLLLETLLDEQNSLKLAMDKLAWDANAKNQERNDLINKYFAVNEQSVEMTESYTKEWQERLEKTNVDVSAKLATILNENQHAKEVSPAIVDIEEYDGEEKKETNDSASLGRKDP